MEVVTTDVLVIGGGVAGLSTAIVAREKGLDVLLCSKTAPGLANSSALSAGGFRSQNSSFSAEDHRRLTLETGHNLNEQVLVDTLVENAHQSIMSLRWYGVTVKERAMGFYVPAKEKGPAGLCLTRPMADYARSAGVRFLYPFQACEIIRGKDKALGVWGLQGYNNKSLAIEAKAVVLATGGGGATFLNRQPSEYHRGWFLSCLPGRTAPYGHGIHTVLSNGHIRNRAGWWQPPAHTG